MGGDASDDATLDAMHAFVDGRWETKEPDCEPDEECWCFNLLALLTADIVTFEYVCRNARKTRCFGASLWRGVHAESYLSLIHISEPTRPY